MQFYFLHKLYPLDGFKSYYSDKLPNKVTGTGVALCIHKSFNALIYEEVTTTLPHLETLCCAIFYLVVKNLE